MGGEIYFLFAPPEPPRAAVEPIGTKANYGTWLFFFYSVHSTIIPKKFQNFSMTSFGVVFTLLTQNRRECKRKPAASVEHFCGTRAENRVPALTPAGVCRAVPRGNRGGALARGRTRRARGVGTSRPFSFARGVIHVHGACPRFSARPAAQEIAKRPVRKCSLGCRAVRKEVMSLEGQIASATTQEKWDQ